MAQHASTAARIALGHRVRARAIHPTHDMLGAYRELADVVHEPIEGLRDRRAQEPIYVAFLVRILAGPVLVDTLVRRTDPK